MRISRLFTIWPIFQMICLATAFAQAPPVLNVNLPKPAEDMAAAESMSLPDQPERLSAEYLELVSFRATSSRAVVPENGGKKHGVYWGSLFGQYLTWLTFQHIDRIIMEPQTRAELNGRYFHDWSYIVHHVDWGRWSDGDKFFTSDIGHPAQGAVVGYIFRQNDGTARGVEQDFHNPAYTHGLLKSFLFMTVDAFNWKLGPASEATIGHVGLHYNPYTHSNRTGLNDYVTNEVGGIPLMMGEDWLDKHAAIPFERHHTNRWAINTVRIFTMPSQSFADLMAFKKPWYRYGRN